MVNSLNQLCNENLVIVARHAVLVLKRTLLDVALHLMPYARVVLARRDRHVARHFAVKLVYPVREDKAPQPTGTG